MTFSEFKKEYEKMGRFHDVVRDMVIEAGGLNLWDGHDLEMFYEVYTNSIDIVPIFE